MAHFAELDEHNMVKNVIVISNNDITDENGNEIEDLGIQLCKNLFGADTNWKQTSYNNNFRARYAGIGSLYLEDQDIFTDPKPFESWILNMETFFWEPPIPYPENYSDLTYYWDENTQSWIKYS